MNSRHFLLSFSVIFLLYSIIATTLTTKISYEFLGPRPFPLLLGNFGLATCLLFVILNKPTPDEPKIQLKAIIKILPTVVIAFGYVFLFEKIGFILSTFLALIASGYFFYPKSFPRYLSVATPTFMLMSVFMFVLFSLLFEITLPEGAIETLLSDYYYS